MGSPITSWENVEAYFTGFGGVTTVLVLAVAVFACFGALYLGHRHEKEAYDSIGIEK